jgi:SAM-dependent methyltransferase
VDENWEQHADRLAARSIRAGDPTGWFEELYAAGRAGSVAVPWNREQPQPLLAGWTRERALDGTGLRAVVVGCGLGADAEHVAALGYDTVAFDVSGTAVDLARDRHPGSDVRYVVADLLALPPDWIGAHDLVVEVYTVQALPEPPRRRAIGEVARWHAGRRGGRPRRSGPGTRGAAVAAHPRRGRGLRGRRSRRRGDQPHP